MEVLVMEFLNDPKFGGVSPKMVVKVMVTVIHVIMIVVVQVMQVVMFLVQ
jgi:hypothetical protein